MDDNGYRWDIEKWREEYKELFDQCEKHAIERNRLGDALQKIAALSDTGSDDYKKFVERHKAVGVEPTAWRIVEEIREIALSVVGMPENGE